MNYVFKKWTVCPFAMLCIFSIITSMRLDAQNLHQVIRGTVLDKDTHVPLIGATIFVIDSNPVLGNVTDEHGNFTIRDVPVGRYNIQARYVGYEPVIIPEVVVSSGRETVLSVEMSESAVNLEQVEVKATVRKDRAINSMAMISARQLTMEEASRYAGGIDDPSRLASSFAGVAGNLSTNAIIIRGNAPKGLQWRMEGVEIPNPSHFANVTTFGGGGLTALSSQMLANSDFYTGAFPAEFGNALSGVFDMKMRTGNTERHENTFRAGLTGLDFAAEGPFAKGKTASYLFNYRYSTLALISGLLPENAQGIRYQDLAFKVFIPAGKAGNLSLWGLFSTDRTGSEARRDSALWIYVEDREKDLNRNRMGAMGINDQVVLRESTYLHLTAAVTGNFIGWIRQKLNQELDFYEQDHIQQNERKYTVQVLINHKFSPRHTNRTGIVFNRLTYGVLLRSAGEDQTMVTYADTHGGSNLIQGFTQSRYNLSNQLILNAGVHSQWFTLNGSVTLEPRIGLKWRLTNGLDLSVAYGKHSRLEPLAFYLANRNGPAGTTHPNKSLRLTQAHHLVFGFEMQTGRYGRIRLEPYYERLVKVPVIPHNSFSMANLESDWFFNDSLVNLGTGTNFGVDLTLEHFLHNGFYYLITASVFQSVYTGGDGVERPSRFDKNLVFNILSGKEWKLGKQDNNMLGVNWRFSFLGGDRISPVDMAASNVAQDVIYDDVHAFADRKPATWYLDFTASWRRNRPGYSTTWSLQFVNLLFQKEFFGYRYNLVTHKTEPYKEAVVIPNISYKIDF